MSNLFKSLFGKSVDLGSIYRKGAIILDVRTREEFRTGHILNAINIPVDQVGGAISELKKKNKAVITCCRSGARSGIAKSILEAAGLEVYNGGAWDALEKKIR
ncbi:rhodanese-like domain-containing protein [Flavitalea sp. BT771]|uniref:rhodanese-like domain-containing protein n=1 Tax=Flavitalea sp. BT771 TaxID=3063329 RepID=UPI0026E36485|nr:rhodanese-like domain-containing protein [Flavitalea sp. BT771]MDO6430357.1 rhodanese-like domain-containing protein [Flavitalea sp. BT771]MDV6219503.1 rhodanese-like domain-containing protein [Flavitalea sp. BT771]